MALWAPIIGGAMTLAGSLIGKNERPTIDPEMLKRFQVGELTGFSIGGFCLREEGAEDD